MMPYWLQKLFDLSKSIGILGCGWLGFPLAISLVKKGFEVKGTTTSKSKIPELQKSGIQAFLIRLEAKQIDGQIEEFLKDLGVLVINVPPGLRNRSAPPYIDRMKMLHTAVMKSNLNQILFVSSTSVYGNTEGDVTEDTPPSPVTESARQLLESELLFSQDTELNTTIVRFGGLIGPDRHPVYHLSGRKDLNNGNDAINLIHLDDCIHIISTILENNWWNQLFNAVYPEHPAKAEYYVSEARKRKLEPPRYLPAKVSARSKLIISRNFLNKNQQFYTSIYS